MIGDWENRQIYIFISHYIESMSLYLGRQPNTMNAIVTFGSLIFFFVPLVLWREKHSGFSRKVRSSLLICRGNQSFHRYVNTVFILYCSTHLLGNKIDDSARDRRSLHNRCRASLLISSMMADWRRSWRTSRRRSWLISTLIADLRRVH
jgi:hypothetical protein